MFAPSSNPNPHETGSHQSTERRMLDPEQARRELVAGFRLLVSTMGYDMCSPASSRMDTPEMQERKVTGDPQFMCQRFISDFIGLAQHSRAEGLLGLTVSLEGIGKSADGSRAICLIDAHDTRTGEFLAPLDLERFTPGPQDVLQPVRMSGAAELMSGGVGIVGRFESSAWAHPTFGIMYTKTAYDEALQRLDSIGELIATARSLGARMTTEIPVASSLMSLVLLETEKKARMDALLDSAIYGPDEAGGNKTLGVTRLERSADGTILFGTYMLGDTIKGHGSLLLPEAVERTHRLSIARDDYGMVSVEVLDSQDRRI